MAASRGIQAVRSWQKNLGANVTSVALFAEIMGTDGGEEIARWEQAKGGGELEGTDQTVIGYRDPTWPDEAVELAQLDTNARGQSTRYSVRSYTGDDTRARSKTHLSCVAPREREETAPSLDGSQASVISQLQRGQENATKQLLEMVKLQAGTQASMNALISQLSGALREKETMIGQLVDARTAEQIAHAQQINELMAKANAGGASKDASELAQFVELAAPHVVPHLIGTLMEKFGPMLGSIMQGLAEGPPATAAVAATAELVPKN